MSNKPSRGADKPRKQGYFKMLDVRAKKAKALREAAPELLDACNQARNCFKLLMEHGHGEPHISTSKIIEYLDRAISKAEAV